MTSNFDHVTHRLVRLEEQLDKLDQTCDSIAERMHHGQKDQTRLEETVNQTIVRIEGKIMSLTTSVDGKVNSVDARLKALETQVKLLLYVIVAITATSPFIPEVIKKLVFAH